MILLTCFRSCCEYLFRQPRKRLSKTYLESLKDIQEHKFSTSMRKSPSSPVELIEFPATDAIIIPLIEPTDENEDNINRTQPRESLLKLEKFYETNIKSLFEEVIHRVLASFDGFERIFEDLKSKHHLVMYMTSELDIDKNRIFTYRTEWIAPCEPEYLMGFLNDYQEQLRLSDGKMEEYYPIKTFGSKNNFSIVYLKYKKVLTYSPRDFCYLKCAQLIDEGRNIWIDCSQSISNELLPEYDDIERGNILLHGYYIEPICIDGQNFSKVRFYSQIDFKISIPLFLSKTFSIMEMKKYVQRCYERIEQAVNEKKIFQ